MITRSDLSVNNWADRIPIRDQFSTLLNKSLPKHVSFNLFSQNVLKCNANLHLFVTCQNPLTIIHPEFLLFTCLPLLSKYCDKEEVRESH